MSQKSIIVTGAAGRIGAATALLAASKGWAVAVHNRSNPESSEKVVSNIKNSAGLLKRLKLIWPMKSRLWVSFAH